MLTIGLTGGIGSGKSTVAKLFSELGIPVYDTDDIARKLTEPGQIALTEIKSVFGASYFDEHGKMDRKKLASLIFNDVKAKKQLESILHPHIRKDLLDLINNCTAPYCVAVIPLLIETNWKNIVDRILVVYTTEENQIYRVIHRDDASENLVKSIIKSQVDTSTRLNAADDIVENNGSIEDLRLKVLALHRKYLDISSHIKA